MIAFDAPLNLNWTTKSLNNDTFADSFIRSNAISQVLGGEICKSLVTQKTG